MAQKLFLGLTIFVAIIFLCDAQAYGNQNFSSPGLDSSSNQIDNIAWTCARDCWLTENENASFYDFEKRTPGEGVQENWLKNFIAGFCRSENFNSKLRCIKSCQEQGHSEFLDKFSADLNNLTDVFCLQPHGNSEKLYLQLECTFNAKNTKSCIEKHCAHDSGSFFGPGSGKAMCKHQHCFFTCARANLDQECFEGSTQIVELTIRVVKMLGILATQDTDVGNDLCVDFPYVNVLERNIESEIFGPRK